MKVRRERQLGHTKSSDILHKEDVYKGFNDWKIWMFCIGQFGADTMLYGYSTFLPTIIRGLSSWSTAQVQALTVPCYALGAVTYILVARISDAKQQRGLVAVTFGAISVVGYGILISNSSSGVHYFGCFVVAMGLYVVVGIPLSWLPSSKSVRHCGTFKNEDRPSLSLGVCCTVTTNEVSRSTSLWQTNHSYRSTTYNR